MEMAACVVPCGAHQQCGEDSNPRMLTLARDGDIHVGGGNHFLVNQLESVFFA